jgi:hypothetical protein
VSLQSPGGAFGLCDAVGGFYAEFLEAFLLKKSDKRKTTTTPNQLGKARFPSLKRRGA